MGYCEKLIFFVGWVFFYLRVYVLVMKFLNFISGDIILWKNVFFFCDGENNIYYFIEFDILFYYIVNVEIKILWMVLFLDFRGYIRFL